MAFHPAVAEALLVRAGRCCAMCREFKGTMIEIHHIVAVCDGGTDDFDNGIPLCFECHAEVRAYDPKHPKGRRFTASELRKHRERLFALVEAGALPNNGARKCATVIAIGSSSIAASAGGDIHITMKTPRAKSPSILVLGTVAEDAVMFGYLRYLADRYYKFKEWDCRRNGQKMNYAIIYQSYKRALRYELKHTPLALFENGVDFLQDRISKTIIGRMLTKRGQSVYRSFAEFKSLGADEWSPDES